MDSDDSSSSGSRSQSTERPGSSSRRSSRRGSEVSQLTSSRPKPSRLELSSYVSLLRDLKRDAADRPLTSRLLERWVPRVSVSASSTPAPPSPRLSASDGPGWTRGRREVSSDLESNASVEEMVVNTAQADERLDDRWPLEVEALQPTEVDLAEMIRTIAARQIRTKKLSLPTPRIREIRRRTGSYPAEGSASGSTAESEVTEGSTVDELEDEALPLDIVESTTAFLDQVLVGLAAMRPKETRTKRKGMEAIGWEGVVGAAGLIRGNEGIALEANAKMRELIAAQAAPDLMDPMGGRDAAREPEEDIMKHRLELLGKFEEKNKSGLTESLYSPIMPPEQKSKRRHQSAEEREGRDAKRNRRLEEKEGSAQRRKTARAQAE